MINASKNADFFSCRSIWLSNIKVVLLDGTVRIETIKIIVLNKTNDDFSDGRRGKVVSQNPVFDGTSMILRGFQCRVSDFYK